MAANLKTILTKIQGKFQKNKDFDKWVCLVEHPANPNTYSLHIKKGSYKDTIFFFGKVSLIEEGDQLRLKFDTTVIENPRKHDVKSSKFTKLAGSILEYYLEQCVSGGGIVDTEYLEGSNDKIIEED